MSIHPKRSMLTPTNVIPSMSASVTSNTGTLNPIRNKSWALINSDPRAFVDFESKALCLKEHVKERITKVLIAFPVQFHTWIKVNCVLSGSSISSIYHGEEPKDFDLWYKKLDEPKRHIDAIITNYGDYIATYKNEPGYDSLRHGNLGDEKVITHNAITFIEKLQLITLDDYKTCRQGFDFIHCMPYYDFNDDKFHISENQMKSIAHKKLVKNPEGNGPAEWRIHKFKQRGWSF